ncbi:MAG TPA: peptide ABC transporter substrate-binding protein [Candidatus Paceibacterota bacterium]|nr:peptide ABC transporter substrate-binding protein [Candidatus Paceibacterota bacterium]
MPYSWKQLTKQHEHPRTPVIGTVLSYFRTLRPGDQVIASILAALVIATTLVGLFALQRSFLVTLPAYGGGFTEGIVGTPRFVNPLLALSDADRDLSRLAFAGLMGTGPDGSLIPVLAESYTVSEDGTVYTFVLREGIRFSDNTPITADDVVYTVQKAQDQGLKSPELANWSGITVEATDARTVRFTLPRAYAPFLEETTLGILPAHLWRGVTNEEFPFSPLMTRPVGAGPYEVASVKRDKDGFITGYTFKANKQYALGRPYIDRISFVFFDEESDLELALENGSIDSAYGVARKDALRVPYARIFGTFFNAATNPAFSDGEVRRALSLAVNRDAIVTGILGGYATAINGPVPPGSGIENTPVPVSGNRIEEAATILENAGWKYDQEARVWTKGEDTLRITLRTSNVAELKLIAQQVQADWASLGIPTSLELFEPGDLTQNVIRPRRFEALFFGMVVGRDHDLYAFWNSTERTDPGLNIAQYANTRVDQLLVAARTESDPAVRLGLLQQIETEIADDYPAAFTHTPDFVYALPKGIHGVTLTQIASPADRFATVATWYLYTQDVWPFLAN